MRTKGFHWLLLMSRESIRIKCISFGGASITIRTLLLTIKRARAHVFAVLVQNSAIESLLRSVSDADLFGL